MINLELDFSRSRRNCIIFETSRTTSVAANPPNPGRAATETTSATFQISNAKFYVPVVTLSIDDNVKFLGNIKQRFRRTISWNKYRLEITTQAKNNILDFMIDPTFRNINRLFALSLKNGNDDPKEMLLMSIKFL